MRHLLALLSSLFFTISLLAQIPEDGYTDYESMIGDTVFLYDVVSYKDIHGYYAYEFKDGKSKAIKDAGRYYQLEGNPIKVEEIVTIKKKQYLRIRPLTAQESLYLIIDNRINYYEMARSLNVWSEKFNQLVGRFNYIDISSTLVNNIDRKNQTILLNHYYSISWNPFQMPKRKEDDVNFICLVGDHTYYWTLDAINAHISDFASEAQYSEEEARILAEKKAKERRDSIADCTRICEALVLHTKSAEDALKEYDRPYGEKDNFYLSVYGFDDREEGYGSNKKRVRYYLGYLLGSVVSLKATDVQFSNEESRRFIESRGRDGMERRKETARKNDELRTQEVLEIMDARIEWGLGRLAAVHSFWDKKKIFILSKEYSYSSYEFGLKFEFYNCFNKGIKYINMHIVAYNSVGDVQRDDIGRSSKDVRCIGMIEKGERAIYDFNEMFWDERDIIQKLEVTSVVITFSDNSTVKYSGKSNIDLHTQKHYADEIQKILHEGEENVP